MHDLDPVLPDVLRQAHSLPKGRGIVESADPKFGPGHLQCLQLPQQCARPSQTCQMQIEACRVDPQGQVHNLPLGATNMKTGEHLQQFDSVWLHIRTVQAAAKVSLLAPRSRKARDQSSNEIKVQSCRSRFSPRSWRATSFST